MSSAANLPLSEIVDVVVQIAPLAPEPPSFNQGLIIGPTNVISPQTRVVEYASTSAMLLAGFANNSPEFLAAELYFGQTPPPIIMKIGRQDLTSIAAVQPHVANEGANYVVGDLLTIVQSGGSLGIVKVTSIGGGGAVTGVAIVPNTWNAPGTTGTGYSVASGLATTGGTGTGCEIDILSVGDTPLEALEACRLADSEWWAVMVTTAQNADHLAIAAFVQTMNPVGYYMFTTQDSGALNNTPNNILAELDAASYNRVFSIYSTTQGGVAPNNIYAAAAVMGLAMGLNTGLANSFFTLKFKTLAGVIAEPLTLQQVENIESNNGNLYLTYGGTFTFLEQGTSANGQFFDEILNLDMLAAAIQFALIDLLISNNSIPQTDAGETALIHAVNGVCDQAVQRGFIAGGVWQGVQIINLSPGQSLPNGYLAQAYPYATQLPSDRQARKAMPIYLAIIEAGAVHSILVGVYVQR